MLSFLITLKCSSLRKKPHYLLFPFSRWQNLSSVLWPWPHFSATAFNPTNSLHFFFNTNREECLHVRGKRILSFPRTVNWTLAIWVYVTNYNWKYITSLPCHVYNDNDLQFAWSIPSWTLRVFLCHPISTKYLGRIAKSCKIGVRYFYVNCLICWFIVFIHLLEVEKLKIMRKICSHDFRFSFQVFHEVCLTFWPRNSRNDIISSHNSRKIRTANHTSWKYPCMTLLNRTDSLKVLKIGSCFSREVLTI